MARKISVGWLEIGEEERKAVNEVLDSGIISEGPKTYEFERKWAEYIGVKYCVATSSGTGALITTLTSLKYLYKLEKRLKVITSPLTYISDVNAIVLSGFEPVFIDVDPHTFCITSEGIKDYLDAARNIQEHSIILSVDLMGYPVKSDEIHAIARENNLLVLEDAAQAHGTIYKGKKCGFEADAAIFSFYVAHNIQVGEMGAIVTNNQDIYRISKKIKANGRSCECKLCTRKKGACLPYQSYTGEDDFDPRFFHEFIGYNFKTTEFQAAIALAQLNKIGQIIKKRQENVEYLNSGLKELSEVFHLPLYSKDFSYLAYPLVIKNTHIISRKELRRELEKRNIETRPLFGCIPTQQPAYAYLRAAYMHKLPQAEYIGKNGFYVGCHQYLAKEDLDYVIYSIKKIILASYNG